MHAFDNSQVFEQVISHTIQADACSGGCGSDGGGGGGVVESVYEGVKEVVREPKDTLSTAWRNLDPSLRAEHRPPEPLRMEAPQPITCRPTQLVNVRAGDTVNVESLLTLPLNMYVGFIILFYSIINHVPRKPGSGR